MRIRTPVLLLALAAAMATPAVAQSPETLDDFKIASLLAELDELSPAGLAVLPAREVTPFELPTPGVDVMRARLEETYEIDGIGEETVELTGWIAVRHGRARPVPGATEVAWNTAVVDTQFVGMDLSGHSDLFGEVRVRLDRSRPLPVGQVGQIEIPELARLGLVAELRKDSELTDALPPQEDSDEKKRRAGKTDSRAEGSGWKRALASSVSVRDVSRESEVTPLTIDRVRELTPELSRALAAGNCRAEVQVSIQMGDLGLDLKTSEPVLWYSLVDTIPPVGHTASIAIEPVALISEGREVGTLRSGVVKFREVVKWVAMSDAPLHELPPSDRWAAHRGASEGESPR